jgi:hypothetical protein
MLDSQRNRSAYESYVWSKLNEDTIVSEGRSLVNVRWFVMGDEYFKQRQAVLGFEDLLGNTYDTNKKPFLMVALQMKPGAAYTKSDFKVFWNEQELDVYREIASVLELKSLYPFAYPFHRVFLFEVPESSAEQSDAAAKFSIWTPWGRLEDQEQK